MEGRRLASVDLLEKKGFLGDCDNFSALEDQY